MILSVVVFYCLPKFTTLKSDCLLPLVSSCSGSCPDSEPDGIMLVWGGVGKYAYLYEMRHGLVGSEGLLGKQFKHLMMRAIISSTTNLLLLTFTFLHWISSPLTWVFCCGKLRFTYDQLFFAKYYHTFHNTRSFQPFYTILGIKRRKVKWRGISKLD